ncbi:MAG: pyridoxal phosphate-dependent aminotransferase [Spirochaetes bacterium]|nr:pyridoxal phosphate-dependent aminotransferase [Spirochaetota bacterium]
MSSQFNFDHAPDRRPYDSVKWSYPELSGSTRGDLLPLWVADMDFAGPPEVQLALQQRVAHPVYGYSGRPDSFFSAFAGWMQRRHSTTVERDWLLFVPGIVPAIAAAIRAFTSAGDGVVIMPPVYHPFKTLIEKNHRQCREAPLRIQEGSYRLDLDALDKACRGSRLLLLCSPHNPVGRVWSLPELQAIADLAAKHDLLVFADEIHADLVYEGFRHIPSHEIDQRLSRRLLAAWAPSKTFNIAGLQASCMLIPDQNLRRQFNEELEAAALGQPNCLTAGAATAAYQHGDAWLQAVLEYMQGNYLLLVEQLAEKLPAVKVYPLEGTYLAWLDFSGLKLSGNVHKSIVEKTGLWLDAGSRFGTGGDGFARLNLGCPRTTVQEAVDRLAAAFG